MSEARTDHAAHFESLDVQAHAAKLGMWVFLSSEVLLFAGLFTLYFAARAHDPTAFHDAVKHNTKLFGSTNTAVLLISSTIAATGVHEVRAGRERRAMAFFAATIVMGVAFLVIKFTEYAKHFQDGIYPGGRGSYFVDHQASTHAQFWTLYYVMTGLHAIHVTVGMGVLFSVILGLRNKTIFKGKSYRADIGAMYWHLIDLVWIFLWPLFYLA